MNSENRSRQPDTFARVCRWILAGVLVATLWGWISVSQSGLHIDTSLADMSPATAGIQSLQEALSHTQQLAEQSVVVLLQASDENLVDAALDRVVGVVSDEQFNARVIDEAAIVETLIGKLQPYRFYLLSPAHRTLLDEQQTTRLLDQTLSDLYAPGDSLRPLPFNEDPLNLFGHWLQSRALNPGVPVVKSSDIDALHSRLVNIRLAGDYTDANIQQQLVKQFEQLSDTILAEFPDVSLLSSGVIFFASESAEFAQRDINVISLGSLGGLCVLMLIVFRSFWPLVTPVVSILTGLVVAFVSVHMLFGAVHVFTIVFGASLMGLVIDYSIHYFFHQRSRTQSAVSCQRAGTVQSPALGLYRALALSLVTSIFGFSALMFTTVPSLLKISVFSIVGLVTAWLTVLAIGSALRHAPVKAHRWFVDPIAKLKSYENMSGYSPMLRGAVLLCVSALMIVGLLSVTGEDDPRKFISMPQSLLLETQQVNEMVSSVEPGRFVALDGSNEAQLYTRLDSLRQRLSGESNVITALDLLPAPSRRSADYQLQNTVYAQGGLVDELSGELGLDRSQVADDVREQYTDAGHRLPAIDQLIDGVEGMTGALVTQRDSEWFALAMLEKGSNYDLVESRLQGLEGVTFVDTVRGTAAELKRQRLAATVSLALSLAGLTLLMSWLYGVRRALRMVCVPAVAVLVTVAMLGLLGQSMTLFHTMALFMILGLGMDYVIFLSEMEEEPETTRQAIMLSGLTTIISFGLLSLSSIPVAQGFGLTVLVGNSMNLLLALVVFQPISASEKAG